MASGELGPIDWVIWTLQNGARVARFVRANRIVSRVRDYATLGVLRPLHFNVVHTMRRLSVQMDGGEGGGAYDAANIAMQVCSECRVTMRRLLDCNSNDLHCCLKLFAAKSAAGEERVATWARSEPRDDRPVEQGDANAHLVSTNSVWSALMGRFDGVTSWRPFPCFACNDLTKHADLFKCDRENWARYYRATLVFPLRYQKDPSCTDYENIGFLAFDSRKVGVFGNVPDIFEHRERWPEYRNELEQSAVFHLGALFADTLSGFLRPTYTRGMTCPPKET